MSVKDKATRIVAAQAAVKSAFKTALTDKGVTVTDDLKLKDYPELVTSIEVGPSVDLTNLTAANVKAGVTINGVTGTFTSDANATSSTILSGYWAYVNGQQVEGSIGHSSGLEKTGYLSVYVGEGYLSQGSSMTLTDSNLIAANILQGKTIFGVSGSIDLTNLTAENIKKGVTINGITGTYEAQGSTGGDSGGTDTPSKQTLTAVGFNTHLSLDNADGDYVLDDETKTEYDRTWTHTNGIYRIQWLSGLGWTVGNIVAQNFGNLYTDLVANPYDTSWYYQGSGSLSDVSVTVKSADSGEGEGGDDTSTSYLLVSGFSASNFGGAGTTEDPNGKYYLQDATATGTSRVWISESGHFKIYRSGNYWYIDGVNTNLGDSVYIDNTVDNPYQEDGSSYTWWSMGSPISGASVTLVSGADNGDAPSVTYLYTVSGSSNASANGDYYDTGETFNGAKTYTNGSCYIFFDTSAIAWYLSEHKNNTTNAPIATCFSDDTTQVPTSGWSDGVIVSVYGGGGDTGSGTQTITVTGFADAYYTDMDGEYTYDESLGYYKNSKNYSIRWIDPSSSSLDYKPSTAQWCIVDTGSTVMAHLGGTEGDISSIAGTRNIQVTVDTYTPSVTITVGSSSGGGTAKADYTVTGAGAQEVNGDYYDTGETLDSNYGSYKIYKNANNIYLYFNGNRSESVFSTNPSLTYVYDDIYYGYVCSGLEKDIRTGDWNDDDNRFFFGDRGYGSLPTVTKNQVNASGTTTTCWSCGASFEYDPEGGTPVCPNCNEPQ